MIRLGVISFGQVSVGIPDSIIYEKDIMTDKEYVYFSEGLICSEDGKIGFVLDVSLKIEKGSVRYRGLRVKSVGIGSCNENDQLILLFDDDTKVALTSWNDFNCDGNSYFDLYSKEFDSINTKKIKAIRFVNGRSYDSYTYQLKTNEQEYFIRASNLINEYILEKN